MLISCVLLGLQELCVYMCAYVRLQLKFPCLHACESARGQCCVLEGLQQYASMQMMLIFRWNGPQGICFPTPLNLTLGASRTDY